MARLIVKAKPPHDLTNETVAQKGDIIYIAEDGHEFSQAEGPPNFVIIDVPGLTRAQTRHFEHPWERIIKGEVVNTNATHARVRIYVEHPGAAKQYGLTRAMVEGFIVDIGGVIQSAGNGEIVFDILKEETRAEVRAKFFERIEGEFMGTIKYCRYHFSESQVDTILAGGGYLTVTQQQLANNVLDRRI